MVLPNRRWLKCYLLFCYNNLYNADRLCLRFTRKVSEGWPPKFLQILPPEVPPVKNILDNECIFTSDNVMLIVEVYSQVTLQDIP